MKKLIVCAAIACAAAAVNAATVNWASGSILTPNADGSLGTARVTTASGYNVKMYVWEALAAADVSYTSGELYKWYSDGASTSKDPFGGTSTAITVAPTTGASATTATARGTLVPDNEGDSVYAAVLFVLEDANSGEAKWWMENSGEKATGKAVQTLANLSLKVGGTGADTSWTAAPEPTSGLLLLLGVAGLALKRKRA